MQTTSKYGTSDQIVKTLFQSFTDEMQICIQNCTRCAQVCEQMIHHCLNQGGVHAAPAHLRLLQDCSEICQTAANFMIRESDFHSRTCSVCAEVCSSCAADCDRFGDDEMMKMCADICRQCADSCQRMSQHH